MTPTNNGNRCLVAYATHAGSTAEIARVIGEELARAGYKADVLSVGEVEGLEDYSAAVVGGPMMIGWHREAMNFVRRREQELGRMAVAYFFPAMSLTQPKEERVGKVPVYIDSTLPKPPRDPSRLSLKERYATLPNYLAPVLKKTPRILPVSAAFFTGKLDFSVLGPIYGLFVRLIIHAAPGDFRNWKAIREWAASLHRKFILASAGSER
ncbi:MAG: hypothetical protein JW929_07340 [Anaerolineales bacterium]|nr:hypothetical protein [Anaerolineales bacterium]